MELSSQNPVSTGKRRSRFLYLARLGAALALTFGLLLYAYGRAFIMGMLLGQPQWPFLALTGAVVLVVVLLSRGLTPATPTLAHRLGALLGLVSWAVASGALLWLFSADLIPRALAALLFAAATLWIGWLAWLPFWPLSWPGRLSVLLLFGLLALLFPSLVKVSGLTGDAAIELTWRFGAPPVAPDLASGQEAAGSEESVCLAPLGPEDFPQLLGPHRDGVLPTRLSPDWSRHPPRLLWRKPVGAGWGSFAVARGYAVTQEQRGQQECVVCYRVRDGAQVWAHADTARFESGYGGPGPRATPTLSGGRVYSVGATGLLSCLDGETGRVRWQVNLLEDNDADNLMHGVCASPLVLDEQVLVCPTGKNGISLAGYDCETGKRIWRGGHDQAGYASPMPAQLEGVSQVLLYHSTGVSGHHPKTGEVLWTFPWANYEHIHSSQPIVISSRPARIFVSTGYGKGCALFAVERKDGGWSPRPLWEARELKTKFTTPVLHRGYLYGLDDGILACVEAETGRQMWKRGRYGHGQLLLAGNSLLIQAENGRVVLARASPEGLQEMGQLAALSSKTWNNLALAGRFLLVRNDREAACYEVETERSP